MYYRICIVYLFIVNNGFFFFGLCKQYHSSSALEVLFEKKFSKTLPEEGSSHQAVAIYSMVGLCFNSSEPTCLYNASIILFILI